MLFDESCLIIRLTIKHSGITLTRYFLTLPYISFSARPLAIALCLLCNRRMTSGAMIVSVWCSATGTISTVFHTEAHHLVFELLTNSININILNYLCYNIKFIRSLLKLTDKSLVTIVNSSHFVLVLINSEATATASIEWMKIENCCKWKEIKYKYKLSHS